SLIMHSADATSLPAGSALAVDRGLFAKAVSDAISAHSLITILRTRIETIPLDAYDAVIVASGPLTSQGLANHIAQLAGSKALAFFDAIAPIVHFETIDPNQSWRQSRYDKSGADYINCPMDHLDYERFIDGVLGASEQALANHDKTPFFEGCLPIEVMARRGRDTLRFGPMKPVGLTNPHRPDMRCHAVVQLRQDNRQGSLWNMVGFQTRLRHLDQIELFRMIPGLEKAEFARLGSMHRNSYLSSPDLLDSYFRLRTQPNLRFAGQITGVEGYVESAATGMIVGLLTGLELRLDPRQTSLIQPPPATTSIGALMAYVAGGSIAKSFQPMNANFGLYEPLDGEDMDDQSKRKKPRLRGRARKEALSARARREFADYLEGLRQFGWQASLNSQKP
ncbi:MAG: methylenetetrahydrofolate--tRNA-(uracil(54)-C(5))-methyltransferase (FADH(2)-oxidizing) TrmFO, partial [Pseudomonadota bacterium]